MNLIQAFNKDEALIQEMDALQKSAPEKRQIWWLGQSGFLVQWQGVRVLFDPYLSDSLTRKYASTDKPHVRLSEQVVAPELLRGIHIVTSTHNHTDHLDAETLLPILKNNPSARLVCPEANREFVAERLGCPIGFPVGLNDVPTKNARAEVVFKIGETVLKMHGIPAKHNEIDRDEAGNCRFMGFVLEIGGGKIYHSGDTLWFDELPEILRPFKIDVALLPINGNDPVRRVAGNLDCEEAALLGKAIGAGCVVPCHFDMFAFNTADVADFVRAAERVGQGFRVLRGGEVAPG